MHAKEMPRMATHGKRGIANLDMFRIRINDPGLSLFTTAPLSLGDGEASELEMVNVYVDSFPKDDRWMPPLHGDDVESLSDDLLKELDEQRHNYTGFTGFLEALGCRCSSIEEDFLPCFADEEELQDPQIRRDNYGGTKEHEAPEQSGPASSFQSIISTSFFYVLQKGHLVRPSTEELVRCLDLLPEHLDSIEWKSEFSSANDEAVRAVKRSDWEAACECYETCLLLLQLEAVKESISTNIRTWLMLWVSIPLAYLYQVRLGKYPRCVTLYDQLLHQLTRTDDMNLIELYYSIIWHRRMVLFQWSYTFEEAEEQLLIAKYMRYRAFNEVRVVEEHFPGFVQLQRIINYWGRRTRRGLEGDMRVALCSNLEHLYRRSKMWSEAMKWTREKWRWICTYSDVSHELNVQWRTDDVEFLFLAGRTEEAQWMIGVLEENNNTLPQVVLCRIRYWKAVLLRNSYPIEANKQLQVLRRDLEKNIKTNLSDRKLNSELLVHVKLEISKLNYQHLRHATILERAPIGVEEGKEWDDDLDTTASDLLNEISSNFVLESSEENFRFHLIQGNQLLMSLGKRFKAKDIEEYRNRVYEAVHHFQKCLDLMPQEDKVRSTDEVLDHELELDTFRSTVRARVRCHLSLGMCFLYSSELKLPGVKYNDDLRKEMHPSFEIASTQLNEADVHLQRGMGLANSYGVEDYVPRISEAFGMVYFRLAKRHYEWLTDFRDSMPDFRAHFTDQDGTTKTEVTLLGKTNCGNMYHAHLHFLQLLKDGIFCRYNQYFRVLDSSPSSSNSSPSQIPLIPFERVEVMQIRGNWRGMGVSEQCLTDELLERALAACLCDFIKRTVADINKSTDCFERGLKMDNARTPFDTAEEQNELVSHISTLETTKRMFTHLQRLIVWTVAIKDMIGEDVTLQAMLSFRADPVLAKFLQTDRGDFTRQALLWAERGRSRSLEQQLLANKPLDKPINSMANFNISDDQDEWKNLMDSRHSCGKNTVFVEYTFDATHEFDSDVTELDKYVTWIVYVVTKDDKVHMHSKKATNLSKLSTSLKAMTHNLSKGAKDADKVRKALRDLYDVFIKPISGLLGDMDPADKLVIAADEVLTNVPFSILLNADTEKYLFEDHTIAFTPSLRILEHCHKRLKHLQDSNLRVEPSVALGDPAYLNENERLKQSYFEAWRIESFFNTGSVKVFTGTEATVDNLVRQSEMPVDIVQGFIHVAAHNHVDKDHKSGSLQLAHPSVKHQDPPSAELKESTSEMIKLGNDFASLNVDELGSVQRSGKKSVKATALEDRQARQKARQQKAKEAAEAAELEAEAREKSYLPSERIVQHGSEWRACMVVLSACNSAKGYVLASEGVVGLPRAFLLAGVPCIVASQWELEDKSSSELMVEFYREISQGTSDASSALRTAMLRMMKRQLESDSNEHVDHHVYKWGGYLVWGLPTVTLPPSMMKEDRQRT